ncbi:basic salivary proline-rich protein 2-like [Osmerus eperlanus]|uniref:basic salivary proline-rich protein 2-like n=1 Tax=Osmerus eperlanus TaxID=29151 RepID=UPI002E0F7B74
MADSRQPEDSSSSWSSNGGQDPGAPPAGHRENGFSSHTDSHRENGFHGDAGTHAGAAVDDSTNLPPSPPPSPSTELTGPMERDERVDEAPAPPVEEEEPPDQQEEQPADRLLERADVVGESQALPCQQAKEGHEALNGANHQSELDTTSQEAPQPCPEGSAVDLTGEPATAGVHPEGAPTQRSPEGSAGDLTGEPATADVLPQGAPTQRSPEGSAGDLTGEPATAGVLPQGAPTQRSPEGSAGDLTGEPATAGVHPEGAPTQCSPELPESERETPEGAERSPSPLPEEDFTSMVSKLHMQGPGTTAEQCPLVEEIEKTARSMSAQLKIEDMGVGEGGPDGRSEATPCKSGEEPSPHEENKNKLDYFKDWKLLQRSTGGFEGR